MTENVDFVLIDESVKDLSPSTLIQHLRASSNVVPKFFWVGDESVSVSSDDIAGVIPKPFAPQLIKKALTDAIRDTSEILGTAASKPDVAADFSNARVLVAEDNAVNQMVIRGILGKLGVSLEMASNGEEALRIRCCDERGFDLILMDCEMPKMDGFEATRQIRAWEVDNGVPKVEIVALTAHALPEHNDRAIESGMNTVLHKPIEIQQLEQVLERCTRSHMKDPQAMD